jgi:uncharacterized membrane protein
VVLTESERVSPAVEKETGRLESFSDGVFAVAITLLVLNLVVPELRTPTAGGLARALGKEWPSYLAFVTSFGTILIMWVNHHALLRLVREVDTFLMFSNGFLLLLVTAVPFGTALIARYLGTPAAPTAAAIYAGGFAVGNISYNLLWWSIALQRRLLHPHVTRERVNRTTINFLIGFPIYLGATVLAFWSAYASIGVCFCMWIFWAIAGRPPTSGPAPRA